MFRNRNKHTTGIPAALILTTAILIAICDMGATETRLSTLKCSDPTLKSKAAARFSKALKAIESSPLRSLQLTFEGVTADNIDTECNGDDKLLSLEIGKNAKVTAKGSYTGPCDKLSLGLSFRSMIGEVGWGYSYVWKNPFEFTNPLGHRFHFTADGNVLVKPGVFAGSDVQVIAQTTPKSRRCKIENPSNGKIVRIELLRQVMQGISDAIRDDLRQSETACNAAEQGKIYAKLTEALTKKTNIDTVVLPADNDNDDNPYHKEEEKKLKGNLKAQFSQEDVLLSCNNHGKVQTIRLKQPIQISFSGANDQQHCGFTVEWWSGVPFSMDVFVQLSIDSNYPYPDLWFASWDLAVTGKMARYQDCIDSGKKGYWFVHRFDKLQTWMEKFLGGRLTEQLKDYVKA